MPFLGLVESLSARFLSARTNRLARCNLRHVAQVPQADYELDIERREWVICLGRGFNWLHIPNQALIIGPYSPDLSDPGTTPPAYCRATWRPGGFRLTAFCCWRRYPLPKSASTARAEFKSRFLSGFAAEVITREFPQLAEKMHRRTAVLNWGSRHIELLNGV